MSGLTGCLENAPKVNLHVNSPLSLDPEAEKEAIRKVITEETEGTYADKNAAIKHKEYGWNHALSEIITALRNSALQLDFLHEHNYSPYNCLSNMVVIESGKWQIKGLENKIPMLYSIKMQKPS